MNANKGCEVPMLHPDIRQHFSGVLLNAHGDIVCYLAKEINRIFSQTEICKLISHMAKKKIMKPLDKYLKFAQGLTGEEGLFKNKKALAEYTGISPSQVTKYQTAEHMQNIGKFLDFLEKVGGRLTFGDWRSVEASQDVCFVNARIVSAGENASPPQAEDYIAAPVVGEVGAGPGYLPEEEVKSWFLAYKHLPAIRHRKNLIAVEIGPSSTSMQPTLNPGDIVLVDRDDRDVSKPGRMMLVRDPDDGSGMVKRVSVVEKKDDFQITYYSDNGTKWPPIIYSWRHDFEKDWDKAIVGRVIWAWSDVREK